ncbi:MAG: sodium ion-translocating decarboxylase subunit beta [Bacteroidales bacterium]|nr:sodium ion-translocating decarboxylase subunit beta [Bacteroidales bacterium]
MENSTSIASQLQGSFQQFISSTSFSGISWCHFILICLGLALIYLAIVKEREPLLLIPIGFGIIIGNIPLPHGLQIGVDIQGSVLNQLQYGLTHGLYPALIFLGLGAMTDFSSIISNPKLILIGAFAQLGILASFLISSSFGLTHAEASTIGMIGSANGTVAIFLSSKLTPDLLGSIAITTYILMALVIVLQPPIMKFLTTKNERLIKMKPPRQVTQLEKVLFPIFGLLLTAFVVPASLPLLGMLFFGNLLKESAVTKRLAETAKGPMIDIITILIGFTVGISVQSSIFSSNKIIWIILIGTISFIVSTIIGIIFVKVLNLFLKPDNRINPLIGNAGVSAVPDSARASQIVGLEYDKNNHLLMHAMGPSVAGVIASTLVAGVLISYFI